MRVGGVWVGLGFGDSSEEIRAIKTFMRRKFSYASRLSDTSLFDAPMVDVVAEMQSRYKAAGRIGVFTPGIINLETKYAMGWLLRPATPRPVIFTVEGHLASMWQGPAAETGRLLEAWGVAKWQPVGYDNFSKPFRNQTGISELRRLLADRVLLPPGTPWCLAVYSQGGIVGSEVWLNEIAPRTGSLHWRLQDWAGTVAYGNPYREVNQVADWVLDPPRVNTHGISNRRMVNTPPAWKEVSRRGDLYAENDSSEAGEYRTAVYLAVQGQVWRDPDSLLNQLIELYQRPLPETLAVIQAVSSGVMFLGSGLRAHAGYDLKPGVQFLSNQLQRKKAA